MDGRTGQPVTGMAGVTVIAPDAMTADALSTALFILGPQRGVALLRDRPGCEALWIPDTPDQLTLLATPGFATRLTPVGNTPYRLTVVTGEEPESTRPPLSPVPAGQEKKGVVP
jgi:hypothetical protein